MNDMEDNLKIGLGVGLLTSFSVLILLKVIEINSIVKIIISYLNVGVGFLTAFLISKRSKNKPEKRENTIEMYNYKTLSENISNIKTTIPMLKNLLKIRREINELKNESVLLMGMTIDKMKEKNSKLYQNI